VRLFVAIEIGEDVAAEAARVIERLRARVATLAPHARVTWVTPERMHLTVRFIGQADDDHVLAIRDALAAPLDVSPFDLHCAGTGTFPPRGAPRVIWAGVADAVEPLAATERAVTARLEQAGVPAEDRPYAPHLTLARIKEPGGLRAAALLERVERHEFGRVRVGAITLFESRLSPKGPTYVPVARTPLAGRR